MALFKKDITKDEFVAFLLILRNEIDEQASELFSESFDCNPNDKEFIVELRFFTLWIITIYSPPGNTEIKDLLHDKFCENFDLKDESKIFFLKVATKRYTKYYEAFNLWQSDTSNPTGGMTFGSLMIEIIINKNPNAVMKDLVTNIDPMETMKAVMIFGSLIDTIKTSMESLKKDYKLDQIMG